MDETPVSDSQARDTAADEQKIQRAMKLACCAAPFLSGLVAVAEVRVDSRIKTAGVFPSGRIVISPTLLDQLPISDVAFILAHELMHLFLQSHQRLGDDPDF